MACTATGMHGRAAEQADSLGVAAGLIEGKGDLRQSF